MPVFGGNIGTRSFADVQQDGGLEHPQGAMYTRKATTQNCISAAPPPCRPPPCLLLPTCHIAASAPLTSSPGAHIPVGLLLPHNDHFWEHELFNGQLVSEELRRGFQYVGFVPRRGRLPILLAAVAGRDHVDDWFQWVARRHRKHVLQPHQCSKPLPPMSWFGWLDACKHWRKLGWWIAILYSIGSLLFCVSGVAGEIRVVVQNDDGVRSPAAALINWPNMIAANLCFFPAGAIQIVESTNMDYRSRLKAWQVQLGKGPRPRHRLWPSKFDLQTISWWASVIQWTGMMGFNIATIFSFLSTFIALQPTTMTWCINFGFTYGGAAFTASAVVFGMEATGSWWRALVPSRLEDLHSISWHAAFWNFYGSAGFLVGGAATYATSFSWAQLQVVNGFGNLGGALWFLLGSLAAALEQANPERL